MHFSGTNLLTRCHSASSCFLLFLVPERLFGQYSRNSTKQKPNLLFYRDGPRTPKKRRRGAKGAPHHLAARPRGGARPAMGWAPQAPPRAALSPIYSLATENPTSIYHTPERLWGATAIAKLRFGGQKSLFRHAAGTGKCPRNASPSTPPLPSCSVSSSPMDYEF